MKKITKEIYVPVMSLLSDSKWTSVNTDLKDAFSDYLKSQPDYSSSVTHAVSALQGYLQIEVYGKIGKGKWGDLLKEAVKKGVVIEKSLAHDLLKEVFSVVMKERQAVSDSHPKENYADEKGARLILNLVMSTLQSLMQK